MKLTSNRLRDALLIAISMSLSGVALAQTAPATQGEKTTTELDKITVTGSRIRQVDVETTQPVTIIDRAQIEKQGFQSVSDILQNITATGTPPISRASPLSAGEAAGGTYVSLRNLGAARTLVLVNGKRLGITTSGLADISVLPASAVERIEVLKDGASSIYGSDAIAGVINIITRTSLEGGIASAYIGQYGQGDGDIKKADVVVGHSADRISVLFGAEIRHEDAVYARDRDFSAFPRSNLHPTDNWTTVGAYGGFVTSATNPIPGIPNGTRVVLRPGGNPRVAADYIRQNVNTGSCTTAAGASVTAGCVPGSTLDKSNTNEQTDLRTPVKSTSMFGDITFELTPDIRWRTTGMFNDRDSVRTVAGYPMQAASFTNTAAGMSALSYFNPTGAAIRTWWRRAWEVPRVSSSDLKTYRLDSSLEGSFQMWNRYFDWDVGALYSQNKQRQVTFGNLNTINTQRAVGPSFLNSQGQVQCGTAAAPISFSDCVPFNPFLAYGVAGPGSLANNSALHSFLFQPEVAFGETTTKVYTANLSSTLFTLPAGDLAFAIGLERREESGKFNPDPLAVSGATTNLASGPTRGGYTINEAYAELEIPLLADKPFARELTLDLASRYSDFNTFGDTTNNKIGLKWKPFTSLLVRATANDGFRAPTIADLYGGQSQTFSSFTDPCDTNFGSSATNSTTRANCVAAMGAAANTFRQLQQGFVPAGAPNTQTPVAFLSGSNPTLQPERSKSQTIGFVWSPEFLTGFNVAMDWWKIRIVDTIVGDTPTTILNDCYVQGIASRCSSTLFTRDATLGYVNFMQFGSRNAGFRKVEGFDLDVSYRWKTDFGNFSVTSNSTYTSRDYLVSTNDPRIPLSSVGFTSSFRIRSNLNVGWEYGNWGVSWMARYYSPMKEGCTYFIAGVTDPNLECNEILYSPTGLLPGQGTTSQITRRRVVGANTFHDLQVRWSAPWDATISVGANNVGEHYGPVMYTQPSANVSYYGGFDIGRFYYLKYTQKFSL